MAAHRKPKPPRAKSRSTTWATFVFAGAATATATVYGGGAHADPSPTLSQVKTEVDKLHHEAEEATERYNGATERAEKAERRLEALRDQASRRTAEMNAVRNALGSYATAQYRQGAIDPSVQLALSAAPERFLRRAATADRAGARQSSALGRLRSQLRGTEQLRTEATAEARTLESAQRAAHRHKRTIQSKLKRASKLLAELTPAQRGRVLAQDGHGHGNARADRGDRTTRRADLPKVTAPTSQRAAQAIAYARSALGKPYVWGATGPNGYDCSGLTQAAWKSAGVSLPRTTYTQVNVGQRIPRSQLAPGDLVFFYSGLSHVGLYTGNGQMIHAPRPGAPVRVASIDEMPFNTATRPG
ncbi:C40 family peptidase [Streptomyces gobiensis]|uniref:C40 family peptidase n=1 Tax=Streptomyces gobiensis TaxID=2875706 RepID=UPI001E378865|nr:NlpC/P60 family protein [Streptomyces gobiensis]UGY93188.1 NlpC/P60 family protein [Streptomyces gobiensis]